MTLHGVQRHAEHFGDLRGIEILLETQQHHGARIGRQLQQQQPHPALRQGITGVFDGCGVMRSIDRDDPRLPATLSQTVDASMRHRAQQPVAQMRCAFDLRQVGVQLDEHILRQLFGVFAATGEAQRHAEHPRLVATQELREGATSAALRGEQLALGRDIGFGHGGFQIHGGGLCIHIPLYAQNQPGGCTWGAAGSGAAGSPCASCSE
jgi:hypothetical protein